jgi:hypothetical protein
MRGKARLLIAGVLGIVLLASGYSLVKADSGSTTQGTVNDPLVTKSYVDQLLKNSGQAGQTGQVGLTQDQIKQLIDQELKNSSSTISKPTESSDNQSNLTVVQLLPGQTLFASAGAEIIVRTGKTVAVSQDENGIPDVTTGKDIPAGTAIENNHLLIFPREGRGVKPAPKNTDDIYIMVRGGYTVSNG